jgi:hypothetical protein
VRRSAGSSATAPVSSEISRLQAFPMPPFQGGQMGQFAPASVPFPPPAFQGGQMGQFAPLVANPFAPNVGINPAILQSLLQLRSAGLL